MSNILYYPYINLPRTDWSLRVLMYYESVGSIVPQEYLNTQENKFDPFMMELIQNRLVIPINPIEVLDSPWDISEPFLSYIDENKDQIKKAQKKFSLANKGRISANEHLSPIHADKFDETIFRGLQDLGLATHKKGKWFLVEKKTAQQLMKYLATIVGFKTNRIPTTDFLLPKHFRKTKVIEQKKRETILENLIPFPAEIDLYQLRNFKEKNFDLLEAFRTKVELIVLDPNIHEGTGLFNEKLKELIQRKEELSAKMNESQFSKILFGSICGIIGAFQGLAAAGAAGGIIGGLPGFGTAIWQALQIEKAEKIFDQSGLKYLALVDRRIRNTNFFYTPE